MDPGRVVLLVDDDADSREVFGTILRHGGYEVLEAQNGEEAVRVAREVRPHVIVMDLEMPVLDGYAATMQLKAAASTASVPVIALTAVALARDLERARSAGCVECLVKPVEPLRLLSAVDALLGG